MRVFVRACVRARVCVSMCVRVHVHVRARACVCCASAVLHVHIGNISVNTSHAKLFCNINKGQRDNLGPSPKVSFTSLNIDRRRTLHFDISLLHSQLTKSFCRSKYSFEAGYQG